MFGEWLRRRRHERRWEQRTLAEKLGVSPSYVTRLEKGERQPDLHTLFAAARLFSADPLRLYRLVGR